MTLTPPRGVDRELAQERHGNRIGLIALSCLRQKGALDLRRTQRNVTDDPARGDVCNDVDPRRSVRMIVPGMPSEPFVQRWPAAVE